MLTNRLISEEILEKYRELQLRVTKFSSIEQELINTRDKLDQELLMYKRLNKFNSAALKEKSLSRLHQLIVEGLIDIFELEASILLIHNYDASREYLLEVEGFDFKVEDSPNLAHTLVKMQALYPTEKGQQMLEEDLFSNTILEPFQSGLFYHFDDKESNKKFILLGLITKKKSKLYREINEKTETLFNIFCQQVFTTYGNRLKSITIERQFEQIKQSQNELIKLSLIAKKTKNGVIITDNKGQIEWVNESFTKTTEYELEEIKGKKPKDFLQKESYKSDAAAELSKQLAHHTDVEVTIVNYTKSGKRFYNQLEVTPVKDEEGKLINFIAVQKDITKEVDYKNEILRNNTRFELISTHSNIGVFEWDFETRESNWNDVLYNQYNIPKDCDIKQLFNCWQECIYPSDKNRVMSSFRKLVNNEIKHLDIDFKITQFGTKNIRYLRTIAIVEKTDKNENIRLVGSTIDYTEKQIAEEEIIINERKYRGIIENMNLGLIETDHKGTILFVNQKFYEISHLLNPQELNLSVDPLTFLQNKLRAGKIKGFKKLDKNNYEIELKKYNAERISILVNIAPIFSKEKEITGYILAYLDITAEKNLHRSLEGALEERNQSIEKANYLKHFYERVLNNSPSKIAILSPDLEVVYANELMINSNAIWKNSIGKKINEISEDLLPESKNFYRIKESIHQAINTNSLVQVELEYHEPSGNNSFTLFNILPINNGAKELQNIILTGTDITSVKQIQQAIQEKNNELSKINSELDNFVYSVSHDLRSPLLSIKGILSLIFNTTDINEDVFQYLKMADESIDRLDGTIQEILEYSRNSRLDVQPETFDLCQLVSTIFDDLKFSSETNIEMKLTTSESALIKSDMYRMNTLLKNLIGNAVKYRNKEIDSPFVEFIYFKKENEIIIQVKDNGEGISQSNIDKVFEMFYRANSSSVGTGLGLYICKEIITKLKGNITIESELKVGTTVTITLPIIN